MKNTSDNIPCAGCGIMSVQKAHIASRLYLVRRGIPERFTYESWNIIPLCFDCHQIYDLVNWEGRHNVGRRRAGADDLIKCALIKERLADRFKEANTRITELLAHVRHWDITTGDEIDGEEVTGFDITRISAHMIRVFLYKNGSSP